MLDRACPIVHTLFCYFFSSPVSANCPENPPVAHPSTHSYMCAFSEYIGDTDNMCLLRKQSAQMLTKASYCGNHLYPFSDGYPPN